MRIAEGGIAIFKIKMTYGRRTRFSQCVAATNPLPVARSGRDLMANIAHDVEIYSAVWINAKIVPTRVFKLTTGFFSSRMI